MLFLKNRAFPKIGININWYKIVFFSGKNMCFFREIENLIEDALALYIPSEKVLSSIIFGNAFAENFWYM